MILNLRVILLSNTWKPTFAAYLQTTNPANLRPYAPKAEIPAKLAA